MLTIRISCHLDKFCQITSYVAISLNIIRNRPFRSGFGLKICFPLRSAILFLKYLLVKKFLEIYFAFQLYSFAYFKKCFLYISPIERKGYCNSVITSESFKRLVAILVIYQYSYYPFLSDSDISFALFQIKSM